MHEHAQIEGGGYLEKSPGRDTKAAGDQAGGAGGGHGRVPADHQLPGKWKVQPFRHPRHQVGEIFWDARGGYFYL